MVDSFCLILIKFLILLFFFLVQISLQVPIDFFFGSQSTRIQKHTRLHIRIYTLNAQNKNNKKQQFHLITMNGKYGMMQKKK